jgi:hypothetical protein
VGHAPRAARRPSHTTWRPSTAVTAGGDDVPVDKLLDLAAARHATALAAFRELLDDMASDDRPSLAALLLAVRQLEPLRG